MLLLKENISDRAKLSYLIGLPPDVRKLGCVAMTGSVSPVIYSFLLRLFIQLYLNSGGLIALAFLV